MTQCITLMENMSPLQTSQSIVLQKKSVLGNEGLRRMECWELGSGRRVGDRSEGKGREGKGNERMEEQQKKENKNSDEEHKRNSSGCESCLFSTC